MPFAATSINKLLYEKEDYWNLQKGAAERMFLENMFEFGLVVTVICIFPNNRRNESAESQRPRRPRAEGRSPSPPRRRGTPLEAPLLRGTGTAHRPRDAAESRLHQNGERAVARLQTGSTVLPQQLWNPRAEPQGFALMKPSMKTFSSNVSSRRSALLTYKVIPSATAEEQMDGKSTCNRDEH